MTSRVCLALVCVVYVAHGLYFGGYIADDAGISFSYARSLTRGAGLVLSPGAERVEGYSNFLWTMMLAVSRALGIGPVVAAKMLGLGFGVACIVLTRRLTMVIAPEAPSAAGVMAGFLVAANSSFTIWSISGLEGSLFALLLLAGCLACVNARGQSHHGHLLAGGVMAAAALTRPEGVLYLTALGGCVLASAIGRRRPAVALGYGLAAGLPLVAYHLWRLSYFGDWLPNTYYAKVHTPLADALLSGSAGGWSYVKDAAFHYRLVPLALLALVPLASRCHRTAAAPAAVILVTGIVFVAAVGGDWMGEFRFLSWMFPVLYALMAAGLAILLREGTRRLRERPWCAWAGPVAAIGCCALLASPAPHNSREFKREPTVPLTGPAEVGRYFQALAREAGVANGSLLTPDVGGASYYSKLEIIDLAGLTDRHIARHRYRPEFFRRYVFEERRPTFIHTHGYWTKVSGIESYPELARDYVLLQATRARGPHSDEFPSRSYARRDVYASLQRARDRGARSP